MVSHAGVFDACAFRAGEHCFAVDTSCVAEVLHSARLTPVPLAPESIVGLLHLRGRIVPVIDMRRRLGLPAADPDASRINLVIRLGDDWYSLLVDEVLDVQSIHLDRIERPVKSVDGAATDAVTGVFADEARLVHILDPERLVQSLHRQRISSLVRHGVTHGG
ncbi:MAG: chemotaxis protein CheW [Planctomycetia bacterium]